MGNQQYGAIWSLDNYMDDKYSTKKLIKLLISS